MVRLALVTSVTCRPGRASAAAGPAGQVPGDPAVHRAEQQIAALRGRPQRRVAIQQPAQLRAREVGGHRQSGARQDSRRRRSAEPAGSAGRWFWCPARRWPGRPAPRCAGSRPRSSRAGWSPRGRPPGPAFDPGVGECLRHDFPDDGPDLGGVVLHPAGPWESTGGVPAGRSRPFGPAGRTACSGSTSCPGRAPRRISRSPVTPVAELAGDGPAGPHDLGDQRGPRPQPLVADPVDRTLDADHRHHISAAVADRRRDPGHARPRPRRPNRPSPGRGSRPVRAAARPGR